MAKKKDEIDKLLGQPVKQNWRDLKDQLFIDIWERNNHRPGATAREMGVRREVVYHIRKRLGLL
jgi:hypothetical protein